MDPSADPVSALTGPIPMQPPDDAVAICIHHSGRCFRVSFELATVFMRRARQILDNDRGELVPLLHAEGFDMLFVARQTPLQLHDLRDHSLDTAHHAGRGASAGSADAPARNP
jgi:hypothetical protein